MQQPDLGKTIAKHRRSRGVTQEELAIRCGCTVRTVQRIESGSVMPRKYTLDRISEVLEGELFGTKPHFFLRAQENLRDLFNFKKNKMAKISFLSSVLLTTGLGVFLLSAESKAQVQNPATETTKQIKGLIVGDAPYFGIDSIPVGEYLMINAAATAQGVRSGSGSINFRGDKFELDYGNIAYLNDSYFATLEKGDTILLPYKRTDKWIVRKHSPVEFVSSINSTIRYVSPTKPCIGTDDMHGKQRSGYHFDNGMELREIDGGLYVNGERQFDLPDYSTVVIDMDWKVHVMKK